MGTMKVRTLHRKTVSTQIAYYLVRYFQLSSHMRNHEWNTTLFCAYTFLFNNLKHTPANMFDAFVNYSLAIKLLFFQIALHKLHSTLHFPQ